MTTYTKSYRPVSVYLDIVSQLREIPEDDIFEGMIVFVAGQNTSTDGKGGIYTYSPDSTEDAQSTDIVAPRNVSVGRWHRIVAGVRDAQGDFFASYPDAPAADAATGRANVQDGEVFRYFSDDEAASVVFARRVDAASQTIIATYPTTKALDDAIEAVRDVGTGALSEVIAQADRADAAADNAETSAAFSEEFAGPAYATPEAGRDATAVGYFFRVPIAGTDPREYKRYERTTSGFVIAAPLATETRVKRIGIPQDYAGANFAAQFEAAVRAISAQGGGTLTIPSGDYQVNGNLLFPYGVQNVTVMAYGAVFRNARLSIQGGYGLGDARFINFFGGTLTQASGSDADYLLDISGKDILIRDTKFRCINAAGDIVPKPGYVGFFRADVANFSRAERVTLDNVEFDGSNGLLVAGRGHLITRNRWKNASIYQTVFGGDDAVAIKAIGESSSDIEISDSTFEGYAGIASLGSEIGANGVDDPSFSIGLTDIRVLRNRGLRCASLIYVKPGAIGVIEPAYDYRNGLLDKISIKDNVLEDLTGERMLTPIAVHMGRGSKLANLELINNTIRGRMKAGNDSALNAVMQVMIRDLGSGSTVENIEIDGLHFINPTDSADPTGTNGFRPRFFLQAEREHPTEGAIKRIRVDNITCNGTSGTAFFIGQNVEGPITLASRDITNIAANAPSSVYDAAISAQSNGLVVEGGGRLSLAKTTTVPIKTAAGKTIAAQRDERFIGDLSANRTIQWVPPVKCQITGILLVVDAAFSASNSPDLWTMTFRGSDGNALTVKNTLPGDGDEISPLIAGVPKRVAAGTYQALNAVFSLGQSMKVDFAKAGNAPTFVGLRMIVEYVPLAS